MDFFETVDRRRSVRAFLPREVDASAISRILEAVTLAPSAGDLQAYKVSVVKSKEARSGLMAACLDQEFIAQAPAVLVFSADKKQSEAKYGERGHSLYAVQDATIAAAYCQLAATALGLSSVWVGAFDPLEVSRLIKAGPEEVPMAVIPIGHPAESPERTERRPPGELLREI